MSRPIVIAFCCLGAFSAPLFAQAGVERPGTDSTHPREEPVYGCPATATSPSSA